MTLPCKKCKAKCCRYVVIRWTAPRSKADFDELMWFLYHDNFNVFIDTLRRWNLEVICDCAALDTDDKCTVYASRPRVCRRYPANFEICDYEDAVYRQYFRTPGELAKYLDKRGVDWRFKKNFGKGVYSA